MEDSGHIPIWTEQRVLSTNARGRHSYCEPFKAWIVEQAMRPGMSLAGLAMRNQVNANQLRRWVLLHRREAAGQAVGQVAGASRLLPVTIAPQAVPLHAMACSPSAPVEIELAGAVVRVPEGTSAQTLHLVIAALRRTPS